MSNRRVLKKQPQIKKLLKAIDSLQPSVVISELEKHGLSAEGFENVLKNRLFRFRVLAIDANAPY